MFENCKGFLIIQTKMNAQLLDQLLEVQKKASAKKRSLLSTDDPASSQLQHPSPAQAQESTSFSSKQRSKISETVRSKLSLGAKMLKVGGVQKIFRRVFGARGGEMLLKASHCYLSTTAGPILGLLFISTDKVAFCSDRSIKMSSPTGENHRFLYKVSIPLTNIARANQSENVNRPSEKYLQLITTDEFEFWFIGFLNYRKTIKCLHQAITQA